MRVFILILAGIIFLSCRKEKKAFADPASQAVKFREVVGKYLVHDSIVTRDPGVIYTEVIGRGKGSDQKFGADGRVEIYISVSSTRVMHYEFKPPDTLFVWDAGTARHYDWYTNVNIPRKDHLIMKQKIQRRVIEFHYTAE
jgi:hypothetical protein